MSKFEGLCERWCGGDERAGEELFREGRHAIESFLLSKVREADVDDLSQKVMEALLRARPRFRADAPPEQKISAGFRAFMFGVARKVLLVYIRGRLREQDFEPAELSLASLDPSLSRQLSAQRHLQNLHAALLQLSLEQQIAFELRELQELSYPEIAAALEIAEGTAKSRVRAARKVLAEKHGIVFRSSEGSGEKK